MDDFVCPRCKTSKFQNPSLKMMVNVCGHGLCENCVDLLFLKGKIPYKWTFFTWFSLVYWMLKKIYKCAPFYYILCDCI